MTATADDQDTRPRAAASKAALAFKITAFAEAVSWIGLLIGMFFKWIVQSGELGVRIFGPIHGTIFILYVLSLIWVSTSHKWRGKDTLLGLVSSIPPLMTIWFERRAERRGLLTGRQIG
ncbi:DUF3817 domain-containing protein [Flexivirga meconopsidis]|uniref:DUF3817 domain-containing protein n=1 Tax=Flexivirga meconopsidis TaxID=2977121 RepID=UPI00223FF877|nr:DUF3817 domain-containing protein [Flexivirga meconopsidis]